MTKPHPPTKPFSISSLFGTATCQQEMLRFVLVSTLDVFMTYVLLRQPGGRFMESNPIARYFIYGWGVKGMVGFKLSMTALRFGNILPPSDCKTAVRITGSADRASSSKRGGRSMGERCVNSR